MEILYLAVSEAKFQELHDNEAGSSWPMVH